MFEYSEKHVSFVSDHRSGKNIKRLSVKHWRQYPRIPPPRSFLELISLTDDQHKEVRHVIRETACTHSPGTDEIQTTTYSDFDFDFTRTSLYEPHSNGRVEFKSRRDIDAE